MKKFFILAAIMTLLVPFRAALNAGEVEEAATGAVPEAAAKLEQPILISSAGQSADAKLVGMLTKRLKLNATTESMATAANLEGIKTLIIVPGYSSKGLGAAGVKPEDEAERVASLIKAAQGRNIPIVVVHVGGKARRGPQSDGFNRAAAEAACHMIVVSQGDEDHFFSDLAGEKKIPIELVEKIADTAEPLGKLF
ncbi:MAG TPA: DUF6305 family protein [candidate division Zixibacteria bacterium]|nr:DUF6305 family protein [candidate division Zixibacteria bacterium]